MGNTKSKIDNGQLRVSTEILRALCHPLRMKILQFVDENDNINVNKIYNTLKLEQSITSQHLRILRNAGIVSTKREGKFIYYHINYDKIGNVMQVVRTFLEEEREKQEVEKNFD